MKLELRSGYSEELVLTQESGGLVVACLQRNGQSARFDLLVMLPTGRLGWVSRSCVRIIRGREPFK